MEQAKSRFKVKLIRVVTDSRLRKVERRVAVVLITLSENGLVTLIPVLWHLILILIVCTHSEEW